MQVTLLLSSEIYELMRELPSMSAFHDAGASNTMTVTSGNQELMTAPNNNNVIPQQALVVRLDIWEFCCLVIVFVRAFSCAEAREPIDWRQQQPELREFGELSELFEPRIILGVSAERCCQRGASHFEPANHVGFVQSMYFWSVNLGFSS